MIIPYESAPIPEYGVDLASIDEMLGHLVMQQVPGGIIKPIDGEDSMPVVATVSGRMQAIGGVVKGPMGGRAIFGEAPDLHWHVDRVPDHSRMISHLHTTVQGKVLAQLVMPKPAFWEAGFPAVSVQFPAEIARMLDDGKIDDELLQPRVYSKLLGKGDVLTFVAGGPNPTVHNFTTKTAVRRSAFYAAAVPLE